MSDWSEEDIYAALSGLDRKLLEARRRHPLPPRIHDSTFSAEERQHADLLWLLLNSLNSFAGDFRCALELSAFVLRDVESADVGWASIAWRDSALTIVNFRDALREIEHTVRQCPPLNTDERRYKLRSIIGRFGNAFPKAKTLRGIVAHPIQHYGVSGAAKRHSLPSGLVIHCNLVGGQVVHSWAGTQIAFEFNEGALGKLYEFRDAAFSLFGGPESPL